MLREPGTRFALLGAGADAREPPARTCLVRPVGLGYGQAWTVVDAVVWRKNGPDVPLKAVLMLKFRGVPAPAEPLNPDAHSGPSNVSVFTLE